MTCPECESPGSEQEYAAFHRDLCVLLQLDPERATPDDVLRLVGEVVDRATEAERVAERLERMREKRFWCAHQTKRWRWWVPRYLVREYVANRRKIMTYLDRIAALREALSSVAEEFSPYGHDTIAKAALSADDLAAAEPLPDLPLAEGSRWNGFDGSAHSVTDWTGDRVWLTQSRTGTMVSTSRIEEANTDGPYLLDVLALARRAGVV